ncbi:hypothetical protein DV738_g92, partial [Chaetothyriales sp. CBS 135597]
MPMPANAGAAFQFQLHPLLSNAVVIRGAMTSTTNGQRSLASLAEEVDKAFLEPCSIPRMVTMSTELTKQYHDKLQNDHACMLPSFCYTFPTGEETGHFIALDVGGSTFRIALVELAGRAQKEKGMVMHHMIAHKIGEPVRKLEGTQFFDWMGARIKEVVDATSSLHQDREGTPLRLGLTWSFPIEQTSHRSGKLQGMGKGFRASDSTLGMELADLLESACARQGVAVAVEAVINDGAATLLSQAYLDASTSIGLIVGTGCNTAVYVPTSVIGASKLAGRDAAWLEKAKRVVINTEMSMFGLGILPRTRWDEIVNQNTGKPDFQPLEFMTTGRYLGELLRLVIVDAVEHCQLFGGVLPPVLAELYTLDTAILAQMEEDQTDDLAPSTELITKSFELKTKPTLDEIKFLRNATHSISLRAAAYLSSAIHAMWVLHIACNGSVIIKYPGFKDRCANYVSSLIEEGSKSGSGLPAQKVEFQETFEAALFGAAVAVALAPTSNSRPFSSSSSTASASASAAASAGGPSPESIADHCRKVVCVGRNYAEHISELSSARPSQPFWFLKPTTSLKYTNLKLANLDDALPLISGYVMGIDVTARNVQWEAKRKGLPWSISKGFDTFLPISRFIPKSKIPNPHDATVWLTVNGQQRQRDSTALFLFDIPRLLNDISRVMTLEEGDIILTGTPKGVGPLVDGDVVQGGVEVAGEEVPEGRIDVVVEDAKDEDAYVYHET